MTLKPKNNLIGKFSQKYEKSILNEQRFHQFIYFKEESKNINKVVKIAHQFNRVVIQNELERVRCSLEKRPCQAIFYTLTKVFGHLIDGLHVDMASLDRVKTLVKENRKARVIFVPIYKSYADPLILHYINYYNDLELGFTFGNYEDSPKIGFIE